MSKTILTSSNLRKHPPIKETEIKKNWDDLKKISDSNTEVNFKTINSRNPFSDIIKGRAWEGKRCFIIGGGESVNNFNFDLIKYDMTIGINMAFMKVDPTIIFSMDSRFYKWVLSGELGENVKEKLINSKSYKSLLNVGKEEVVKSIYKINCRGKQGIPINLESGIYHGNNSGYAALNLAICLGATKIYLIGFDMKGQDGKQAWFHNGYGEKNNQGEKVYKKFIESFEKITPSIKEKGIEVINLNSDSELKCFKFGSEETIIEDNKNFPLFMEGYAGIGDNIWQRPFIKELSKNRLLYLGTFTPQIYWDLPNVRFVKMNHKDFKMHNKLSSALPVDIWEDKPLNAKILEKPMYWIGFQEGKTISELYEEYYPINIYDFKFPVKPEWLDMAQDIISDLDTQGKKICLIHFPTNRKEWKCPARDPKPEYLQMLVDKYKDEYYFISLADISFEKFTHEPRNIDKIFHYGEVSLEGIFGLCKLCDMVITGNCFLFPISLAIGSKVYGIFGGCQDPALFLDNRMDLSNLAIIKPDPFCNCLKPSHRCNKDIPKDKIIKTFEELKNRKLKKKNLLIYKVGRKYWDGFQDNKYLNKKYNIKYEMDIQDIEIYIKENDITDIISVLYPYKELKEICERYNINWLFCEAFLGKNCTFDKTGSHFTPENDIKKNIDIAPLKDISNLPDHTKMAQPNTISKAEFFQKYDLKADNKFIVIMGQEIDDKSIEHGFCKEIRHYRDYINELANNNLDITFLFKIHPAYKTIKKYKANICDFITNYKNIMPVYEGIDTLFNIFDIFTAYSSTTILEGLIRGKKFASAGYHFFDNDKLVFQLKKLEDYKYLYYNIYNFKIDEDIKQKYINFIYNYYVLDLRSEGIVKRIEQSSKRYFKGE